MRGRVARSEPLQRMKIPTDIDELPAELALKSQEISAHAQVDKSGFTEVQKRNHEADALKATVCYGICYGNWSYSGIST
jgi:hypothetical protein